jgi:hypothetical protein
VVGLKEPVVQLAEYQGSERVGIRGFVGQRDQSAHRVHDLEVCGADLERDLVMAVGLGVVDPVGEAARVATSSLTTATRWGRVADASTMRERIGRS